jgi:hypothetical protein
LLCFLLSACAGSEPKPRPGVREAKACMSRLGSSPTDFEAYIIRSCTNTGVWIVETTDPATGTPEQVDFLNKEYAGAITSTIPTDFALLDEEQRQKLFRLQKALNNALLRDYE